MKGSAHILVGGMISSVIAVLSAGCSFVDAPENLEPELHLLPATDITRNSAIVSAEVERHGSETLTSINFIFKDPYGRSFESGELALENDMVDYLITDLIPGTEYRYTAIGLTSTAQIQTGLLSFVTISNDPPQIGDLEILASNPTSVIVRFPVMSDGGEPINEAGCQVTDITAAVDWSIRVPEEDLIDADEFTVAIQSLLPMHEYQLTPFATNSMGRTLGTPYLFEGTDAFMVETPGDLGNMLEGIPYEMESLTIAGSLNGDDFRTIRDIFLNPAYSLAELDISDVRICEGGGPYDGYLYTVNNTVTTGLFAGLERLKTISLPISAIGIARDVFRGCTSINSLEIPASVESIVSSEGCTSLREISVSAANDRYASSAGALYDNSLKRLLWYPQGRREEPEFPATLTEIGENAFRGYEAGELNVPDGVTRIERSAFSDTSLESLHLGYSLEFIGEYAFDGSSLLRLEVKAELPPVVSDDTFRNADYDMFAECVLYVPAGSVKIYRNHRIWGKFLNIQSL